MGHWQPGAYSLALIISALVAGSISVYSWRRRTAMGATVLALMTLAVAEWSLAYAVELASTELPVKVFWSQVQYLGIVAVPVLWLCFALQYTGHEKWLTGRHLALLAAIPFITLLLVWTNGAHGLIWSDVGLNTDGPLPMFKPSYGLWFWIHWAYSYVLLLLGSGLLIQAFIRSPNLYRGQARALLIGVFVPWVGNILYISGLNPFPLLDLTPFAFTIAGLAVAWGVFRFRLLDIVPVARDKIVESMADGVIVLDAQARIVDINPAACHLIGRTARGSIGQPADVVLAAWPDLVARCREVETMQSEITLGEGQEQHYLNLRVSTLHNRQGKASGRVMVLHDATVLKRAETALQESYRKLEAQNLDLRKLTYAVEQSASTIVITDLDGNIEYVNPAFSRITGYSRQEAIGQNPRLLKSGKHPPEMYEKLWQSISNGQVWQGELINKKKDGTLYWEAATISPVIDETGEIIRYLAVKDDITTRKQVEEELAEAHQQALEAGRLKTQLLANVSHDMRTPLGVILGRVEMLREGLYGPLSEEQRTALTSIISSTEQALTFVNNLLGQAQIESGKVVFNVKSFAPVRLLEGIQSTLSTLAQAKGLALTTTLAPDMPDTVQGDPYWLRQILDNLVSNAVKFTDQGAVTVRIYPAAGRRWALEVADTGQGIPPEAQTYIFEPFRQVDGSATRQQHTGSGLGLSIVKELTTLMGGEVRLASEVGQGSTFTVLLPLALVQAEQKP